MRKPCAPHVYDSRINPTVHMKRGCIRDGCGSTRPGGGKRHPRRPRFGHKYGPGGHKRRLRGTRRVRLGMQGYTSLGVPRVRPYRRAESSPGSMGTPVDARPHPNSAHFTAHLSCRCRCMSKPCAPHVQDSRINPTMHGKRGYIRVGCGSTQPGCEKGRPRQHKFGHKYGPDGHTRRPHGTHRVWLGMQGYRSLGLPRVHPYRRAEMSAGPVCTPVERAKSVVASPLCPLSRTAAPPHGHACTPL